MLRDFGSVQYVLIVILNAGGFDAELNRSHQV